MKDTEFHRRLLNLQPTLHKLAIDLTSNREMALDLVQDTTLEALSLPNPDVCEKNFKETLLGVMRHLFQIHYCRTARLGIGFTNCDECCQVSIAESSSLPTPEDTIAGHDVTKALEQLPESHREPFSLFLSGYKYVEIGGMLNLSLATVKIRIFQARQKLRELLQGYDL